MNPYRASRLTGRTLLACKQCYSARCASLLLLPYSFPSALRVLRQQNDAADY